ncbi:heme/hemin ABC transporter substrate-binding protein [Enterovirga aerilata]|uniref:Hemin ABC transporter substrate-binding protein n=1 Tax=Enterovirga aerilata TaxID=2730920 RepID=A0A849I9B5_9HYPH|nr:hemin ABC transporter substrate-binding protein [Enterovirga sp. DB1703]NNM72875.1 hemin ABC transporter substrate-binding protein [Enterovirga sp. DB1703]
MIALPALSRSPAARFAALLVAALLAFPAGAAEARPPARIVSLGGAVTEILYRLGAGDLVVAVDTTSIHPPEVMRTKPNVGYLRQLSAEGILSARPDLVLAVDGAGPPDVLKQVREAGVPIEPIPEAPTPAGVARKIEAVARAVGREKEAAELLKEVEMGFAALAESRARIARPVRALFILSLQNGRAMVGGRNTTADGMLALAGAENVATGFEGYKPMTDEAILAAQPEVVVMMETGPGAVPAADVLEGAALSQTPAGRDRRLVKMNGLYLLGFGPRTPEAARELLLALKPGFRAE